MRRCSVLLLVFLSSQWEIGYCNTDTTKSPLWEPTWTDHLKRDLLTNYDKDARPTQHFNVTTVDLALTIKHIDLDDVKSLLTVNGWLRMTWSDEKLKWNASNYGNLQVLHLADHEVWEPDVVLYNSAVGNNIDRYANTHCLVYPDGKVLWVPPSQFQVFCNLDLSKWPLDSHTCSLQLGSWTHSGEQINLQSNEETEVSLDASEWDVVKVTKRRNVATYSCCEEPYIDIQFNITLTRRSPTYYSILINPAIVLIVLTLSSFWLPPHAGEKFLSSGTAIIFASIYLVYFCYRLPNMGMNPPLIVLFYSYSLLLVCLSMVVSVVTHNLCHTRCNKPVPWFIECLLRGPLSTILLLPNNKNSFENRSDRRSVAEEMTERHFDDEGTHDKKTILPTSASRDWFNFAIAIDRICFGIYLVIFIIFGLRFLL